MGLELVLPDGEELGFVLLEQPTNPATTRDVPTTPAANARFITALLLVTASQQSHAIAVAYLSS
jgi:hypothetical protein